MHRIAVVILCALGFSSSATSAPSDWKKGATCYEVFVRSFYDSNGDGIGDLKGLIQKLDYINDGAPNSRRSLGARCIWLMPVAESPSYHGYDVTNYYRVNPAYGTNDDFKKLITEAHRRGIKVLVDLVLNHVSSEHPFFKEALRDSASPHRDWFLWSRTKPMVDGPYEVWHKSPVRDEYYYGLFWSGMPDLNYTNPAVREEAKKVARFWLRDMGVDGFRLDAIPYLVEEDGQRMHTRGTHEFLREFSAYVHSVAPSAFTIGEVWDSTGVLLSYYPDQLDAHFAFDVSNEIVDAVRTGSNKKLFSTALRLQREVRATRWSPFLRNHDQTRTMTEFRGVGAQARLAATLLLTFPGLPFVYYGEEIGMTGDKPDARLRTPMQWSRGFAAGFSRGEPWETLQSDAAFRNVEVENRDTSSLLNHYRRLIHLRARNSDLASGELIPLDAGDTTVAAYVRRSGDHAVLVVANLGISPVSSVKLSSLDRLLPAGSYTAKNLIGGMRGAPLRIGSDGRIEDYQPIPSLAPLESYLFQLSRR